MLMKIDLKGKAVTKLTEDEVIISIKPNEYVGPTLITYKDEKELESGKKYLSNKLVYIGSRGGIDLL